MKVGSGKASAFILCPWCLMPEQGGRKIAMNPSPLASRGPLKHEQHEVIDGISYDYKCPDCKLTLNYPRRLI